MIDPTSPSTLYAATFTRGMFRSTNSGASWSAIDSGLTTLAMNALVIDPATPATLYVGTSEGVFATTNGGDSWTDG